MTIAHRSAVVAGCAAIAAILALQVWNSVACYHHDLGDFLVTTAVFVVPPLIPALVALALPNPLRAVGACVLLAPWLVLAYYTDCVRPYAGGGASMIYVAVLLWGTPSAVVGFLLAGPILRKLGVVVGAR